MTVGSEEGGHGDEWATLFPVGRPSRAAVLRIIQFQAELHEWKKESGMSASPIAATVRVCPNAVSRRCEFLSSFLQAHVILECIRQYNLSVIVFSLLMLLCQTWPVSCGIADHLVLWLTRSLLPSRNWPLLFSGILTVDWEREMLASIRIYVCRTKETSCSLSHAKSTRVGVLFSCRLWREEPAHRFQWD